MPNENYTRAELLGTGGTISFVSQDEPVDRQHFAFPGLNGVYSTVLGSRGTIYRVAGTLRAAAANYTATGAALAAVIANLTEIMRDGNVFDLWDTDTHNIAKLYLDSGGSELTNLTIEAFALTSPRYYHVGGTVATVDYAMTFRRVGGD